MKYFLTIAILGFVLMGCADQSPVIEPESDDFGFSSMVEAVMATESTMQRRSPAGENELGNTQNQSLVRILAQELRLSSEQIRRVTAYSTTLFQQLQRVRYAVHNETISREEAHEHIKKIRATFVRSVASILTPPQKRAFTNWVKNNWDR